VLPKGAGLRGANAAEKGEGLGDFEWGDDVAGGRLAARALDQVDPEEWIYAAGNVEGQSDAIASAADRAGRQFDDLCFGFG